MACDDLVEDEGAVCCYEEWQRDYDAAENGMNEDIELSAKLADYAFETWKSSVMDMLVVGEFLSDGSFVIPADEVAKWRKLIDCEYDSLSDDDKASFQEDAHNLEWIFIKHQEMVSDDDWGGGECSV